MRLTFIISVDPVKGLSLLNVLVHSLNLQTRKNFDVIFYNQTLLEESDLFAQLQVQPQFNYRFFSVDRFLGKFPLWDLYTLHCQLLDADLLGDYFMSLHMEEFFDVQYVENASRVLKASGLDILLGNLCRTSFNGAQIANILTTRTADDFDAYLRRQGLKESRHWTFQSYPPSLLGKLGMFKRNLRKFVDFNFRTRMIPDRTGYTQLPTYYEDLYFIRKAFARRYNWFLPGRRMYFQDIHFCQKSGVCELAPEIAKLTPFPNYFNLSKIYHLNHRKFYYQLEDLTFTEALLAVDTEDPVLQTLQKAIRMYQAGSVNLEEALRYTKRNVEGTGSQNLNYKYHMQVIEEARTATRGAPPGMHSPSDIAVDA